MSLPDPVHRKNRPPKATDFEPSQLSLLVFGPGWGEAQVLIFPDGSLGVVDGCSEPRDSDTGKGDPVREFINDWFSRQEHPRLRFVALTHPHDDHYRGLGKLIQAHHQEIAELWRPPMTDHWAKAYIRYRKRCENNPIHAPSDDPIKGLERVFKEFRERRDKVKILGSGQRMLNERIGGYDLSIVSVAPSLNDIDRAQQELLDLVDDRQPRSKPRFDPNLTSAALIISWNRTKILLGGDLVCGKGKFEGWSTASPRIPERQFQVVKIAHHASTGAQDWDLLRRLKPKLSIVTPFRNATNRQPPRPADIKRLIENSRVAITSLPKWPADPKKPQPCVQIPSRPAPPRHNNILTIAGPDPINNAVCVSLNPNGRITQFLLTGEARRYQIP